MDANSRKKPSQLETNDLIAEAVVNAEARRNQAQELLSDEELAAVKEAEELLSDEELAAVNGGSTSLRIEGNLPIIAGMKSNLPIATMGMKRRDLGRDFSA